MKHIEIYKKKQRATEIHTAQQSNESETNCTLKERKKGRVFKFNQIAISVRKNRSVTFESSINYFFLSKDFFTFIVKLVVVVGVVEVFLSKKSRRGQFFAMAHWLTSLFCSLISPWGNLDAKFPSYGRTALVGEYFLLAVLFPPYTSGVCLQTILPYIFLNLSEWNFEEVCIRNSIRA